MLVDFAPEMNGNWFPWSGAFNGGERSGPATYREAYRHVVDVFRGEGAQNVGFAFHANVRSAPAEPWNDMAAYYPGDGYVDWIGISAYGGVFPGYDWEPLSRALDEAYPKLAAMSATKPMAVLETGVIEEQGKDKAAWIRAAYRALRSGRYPRVKAAVWWHERWTNADDRVSDVRIDSDAAATSAYRRAVASPALVDRPTYACAPKS
jgi:beta-mannanase